MMMTISKLFIASLFSAAMLTGCTNNSNQKLELPSLLSNNMVLQQNTEVTLWGSYGKNGKVNINTDWGFESSTKADENGNWVVKVSTPEAGGPYVIHITTKDTAIKIDNVLIGEVWLCSGQSNMEMSIQGFPNQPVSNSEKEIENAHYPNIRLFNVENDFSGHPQTNCKGSWSEVTPENVKDFSAAGYIFGKTLHNNLNVPFGLIQSDWGGTPIESWISKEFIKTTGYYEKELEAVETMDESYDSLLTWREQFPNVDISNLDEDTRYEALGLNSDSLAAMDIDVSNWYEVQLPVYIEKSIVKNYDGVFWCRKQIDIPQRWDGSTLILELGPIDDMDATWINGKYVDGMRGGGNYNIDRKYEIEKTLFTTGKNVIAVAVYDFTGNGGFSGPEDKMKIYPKNSPGDVISLAGAWKCLPLTETAKGKVYTYENPKEQFKDRPNVSSYYRQHTPSVLYNAMISPLVPFTIKGAIWYQGESNIHKAKRYEELFPLLIKNWRNDWGSDLPFYYVQIAPFSYLEGIVDSTGVHAAELRDAQLKTLKVENTGMVVTADIGSFDSIHPPQKIAVGERLALWALNKTYNKETSCISGPLYKSMEKRENKIEIHFDYTCGGLVADKDLNNLLTIAGEDSVFYKAQYSIEDDVLTVWNDKIQNPVSVRYGWKNYFKSALANKAALPASPFRTDN